MLQKQGMVVTIYAVELHWVVGALVLEGVPVHLCYL